MTPFFTIITCTKNSAKYINQCLESVNNQTFSDYEHIIIDGESTDETHNILNNFGVKYYSSPARGISAAMNEGIKQAKGKYLYFLHSDDQLESPDTLAQVQKFLTDNPDLDWVYGQIKEIDGDGNQIGIFPTRSIFQHSNFPLLYLYNYIPHQAVFMNKEVFSKFGSFSTDYQICMDYEYWLRVGNSTTWEYMPIIVAKYRVHDSAVSASKSNYLKNLSERNLLRARALFKLK